MKTQQQERQLNTPPKRLSKQYHRTRWLIVGIVFLFIGVGATVWILTSQSPITTVLPLLIFTILGVLIALFQWLFPLSSTQPEPPSSVQNPQALHHTSVIQQTLPSTGSAPNSPALLEPGPLANKVSYRRIVGFPPPTDPRTIQQRERAVQSISTNLMQANMTALALTGIAGVGKSTLAALVYRYAEEQRVQGHSPFLSETLWLTVDPTVTFADLAGTLFEMLGKPMPDLSNLAPQNQAVTLFNLLNNTDKPRLIIFDQFENLLDWETGYALANRPGVGEWLDIINSQHCMCRFLLTSRPRPVGTRAYPPTYLQAYPVEGLDIAEGVALLRNRGVQGTEGELQAAVTHCEGHAFSLSLLAGLTHDHALALTTLFQDPTLWIGNIARNLLDYTYSRQLNQTQRELLLAFSVYREPIVLEALETMLPHLSKLHLLDALKALRVQYLVEPVGGGYYQLHAIIAEYAYGHFDENDEQANKEAQRATHLRAAQYYQQRAGSSCPPLEKRRNISDVHDLVEAVWHFCHAGQWEAAYRLMEHEKIFSSLKRWGGNAILLELCILMQAQNNWSPTLSQAATLYRYMAWTYNALGKEKGARENNEKALQFYTESGDLEGQGNILDALGWSYYRLGHMKRARAYYEQALQIGKKRGDRLSEAHVLNGLGRVSIRQGQREQALEYFEQALAICKQVNSPQLEGRTLSNLGLIHTFFGHSQKALEYLEQSLLFRRNSGDRRGESAALDNIGQVYKELGQNEKALQYFEEALRIDRTIGDRGLEGWALNDLGWAYNALEQYEQAKVLLEQALHIHQEVGSLPGQCRTTRNLGVSLSMLGQTEQALAYYRQALTIAQEIQDPFERGTILQNAALVYMEQARYDVALACLLVAIQIFDELRSPYRDEAQKWMDLLRKTMGGEQFTTLQATVGPQTQHIIDLAFLSEAMN